MNLNFKNIADKTKEFFNIQPFEPSIEKQYRSHRYHSAKPILLFAFYGGGVTTAFLTLVTLATGQAIDPVRWLYIVSWAGL